MYKTRKPTESGIDRYEATEGETIEQKIERIVNNGEPISDGSPTIFTERKDGVMAEYNPRTDRFDVALDAMTAVGRSHKASRDNVVQMPKKGENNGGTESIQGTSEPTE